MSRQEMPDLPRAAEMVKVPIRLLGMKLAYIFFLIPAFCNMCSGNLKPGRDQAVSGEEALDAIKDPAYMRKLLWHFVEP